MSNEVNKDLYFLGIDPGYGRLGYGVISINSEHSKPRFISGGVIETSSKQSEAQRLLEIETRLLPIIQKYDIEFCAIEEVFFRKNLTTGVQLIQARGVILLNLEKTKIPFIGVAPTSLKKMITGSGRAEKKQIEMIIKKLLSLSEIPGPDDAADGLSLAIYAWLYHRHTKKKIQPQRH